MNIIEKIDQWKNMIIFFLAFVFCAALVEVRIFGYFIYELSLVFAFLISGIYILISKRIMLSKNFILIPLFLLIVWSLIVMQLFEGMKYLPKYFLFALVQSFIFINLTLNFVADKDNFDNFIQSICWVFIGLAFILTGHYFSNGIFINFNEIDLSSLKYLLGFGAVCSFYLMLVKRKVLNMILTYVLIILSMLSLVRKMWLALFIIFVVVSIIYLFRAKILIKKEEYRKTKLLIFGLLLMIVISSILCLFIPKFNSSAMESLGSVNLASISEGDDKRRLLNIAAIDTIRESPIIGNGWGDRVYIEEYDFHSLYHNCFLSVWCQLGLIGLVLYAGIFVYSLIKSIKMIAKKQYFFDGLFILAMWIFSAIILFFRPLNRMSYYLWGIPFILTLVFEALGENKIKSFRLLGS